MDILDEKANKRIRATIKMGHTLSVTWRSSPFSMVWVRDNHTNYDLLGPAPYPGHPYDKPTKQQVAALLREVATIIEES